MHVFLVQVFLVQLITYSSTCVGFLQVSCIIIENVQVLDFYFFHFKRENADLELENNIAKDYFRKLFCSLPIQMQWRSGTARNYSVSSKDWMDPDSNPIVILCQVSEPSIIKGSKWPLGLISKIIVINRGRVRVTPS